MVALVVDEHLRLVDQAAEGGRVQNAVAVALEGAPGRTGGLLVVAPARGDGRLPHKGPASVHQVAAPLRSGLGRDSSADLIFPIGFQDPSAASQLFDSDPAIPMFPGSVRVGPQPAGPSAEDNLMTTHSVTLTERAAERIAEIVSGEPTPAMLRVSVEGGGCSGFQYRFDLVGRSGPR